MSQNIQQFLAKLQSKSTPRKRIFTRPLSELLAQILQENRNNPISVAEITAKTVAFNEQC